MVSLKRFKTMTTWYQSKATKGVVRRKRTLCQVLWMLATRSRQETEDDMVSLYKVVG